MQNVLTALIPIFVLILAGFVLRQRRLLPDEFWLPCETLNYYYMFPALMFSQVAKANLTQFPVRPIAVAILGAVVVSAALLYAWRAWSRQPGAVFSSVIQGRYGPIRMWVLPPRALYGSVGLTLTSISIAVAIPLLNVASIIILMRHGSGGAPSARQIGGALLKPGDHVGRARRRVQSRRAALAGRAVERAVDSRRRIAPARAARRGSRSRREGREGGARPRVPVVGDQIAARALADLLDRLQPRHPGPALTTIVLFNSLPCTPSAYIMAKLLGGDHRLSAGIITVQTALAAVTMPLVLLVFHG